ncbi:MAG: mechanosensitive ion channel family protein, partial [Proteiniphilum sp.]|nr:mechanosensitive ion channel family protein [Proteiniphilum sp.]
MPPEIFITRADSLNTNPVNVQLASAAELIKTGRFEELFDKFLTGSIDFIGKLLIALLIFYVGKWIIRRITKFSYSVFEKKIHDTALRSFLLNILNILLFSTLVIMIINIVGTKTVSIAALIGSVGLAVGLAVKDNLANFAGGVILLFNKPFKGGDYIEAQNV